MKLSVFSPRTVECVFVAFSILFLLICWSPAQDVPPTVSFSFTSFDYPAAKATEAVGINAAGVIVGDYIDAHGATHGFVRRLNGTFINFDYPGATSTALARINDSNQIAGSYIDTSNVPHGFVFTSPNQFTPVE